MNVGWGRGRGVIRCVTVLAVAAAAAGARAELPMGDTAPVDYGQAANWICRPGAGAQGAADGTCGGNLDAIAVDAAGLRTRVPFVPAEAPPIDCFYVYPTTSDDPSFYSDLSADASEKRTVHAQAARLSAACRLFVPVYHQVTSAGLHEMRDGKPATVVGRINDVPYRDIRAAWASYLAQDNGGRGVVLIGHSQGAILLKKLIAQEIDGKPTQARLVGAYLVGNPDLTSISFHAIRPCTTRGETGCLVAWSSYPESYSGERAFGGARGGTPICVNPAAIGGGRGMLKPVLPRPGFAPESDPPLIEPVGQLSAECVTDPQGAVLRVRVESGRYATLMGEALASMVTRPTWGLHSHDVALTQGNMVDDIVAQSATWTKGRR